MINADEGADVAVVARVRCAWKKFRELPPILTQKGASLAVKGRVYTSCVQSCLIYGCETWPMKAQHEAALERTEMRMIRWMCGGSLRERIPSGELRQRMRVEAVKNVVRRNRLRWFGYVERKAEKDWLKRCNVMEIEGARPRSIGCIRHG